MSVNTNTFSAITEEQRIFYQKALIKRLLPELHAYNDAQKSVLPEHSGLTVNWRKFESLDVDTTPLTEGVAGDGQSLDVTAITGTAQQYGKYITMSDILAYAGIDKVMTEGAVLAAEQAAQTVDTIVLNAMATTTNTEGTSTQELTEDFVKKVVLKLKKANARRFSDGYFHALITPDQAYQLMNAEGWVDAAKYGSIKKLLKGEVGELHGVRFMETTNLPDGQGFIYGKDSYGVVDVENGAGKPKIITKDFESGGTSNPLNLIATIGWKNLFLAKVLVPEALCKITTKVAVSA